MSLRAKLVVFLLLGLVLAPARADAPDTCGPQRTLFLSCCDSSGLEGPALDRLPAEVDAAVRANSSGKAWLESVSLMRVQLDRPVLSYLQSGDGLARLQQSALQAAEPRVNLRTFNRIVLLLPTGSYEVPGQGTVGKSCLVCRAGAFMASTAWVFVPNGATHRDLLRSVLHELGHGFGFGHGHSGSDTYGDSEDIMGSGYERYAPQWRWEAGWLQAALADGPGEYRLPVGGVLRVRLPGRRDSYFLQNDDNQLKLRLVTDDSIRLEQDLEEGHPLVDASRGLKLVLIGKDLVRVEAAAQKS